MTAEEPDFLSFGQDLVEQPILKKSGTTSIDFDGLLARPLTVYEDLGNGCGGQLWLAGIVLAKYMLQHHKYGLKEKSMFVRSATLRAEKEKADADAQT